MLRWLVLDLNSFFASCEQQEDPELRDRPVIVVQTMAETTCAIAASYPAKALGIRTGTLVHEARRLCPDLKLVQANHKLYVDYHHRILRAIDKHIPVQEVMSIDEVACRLDKLQQQPAVARKLAQEIKHEIESQVGACLTSSIGISANKLLSKLAFMPLIQNTAKLPRLHDVVSFINQERRLFSGSRPSNRFPLAR